MIEINNAKEDRTIFQEVSDGKRWNAAVEGLGGGALQSWEWGEFRSHHGWEPLRILAEDGRFAAQILFRHLRGLGIFAYTPHGPLAADEEELPEVAEAASLQAMQRGACLFQVEPRVEETTGFKASGFKKSSSSVQPRCTFMIPILDGPEEQLAALPKDARYGVRRAQREGVEITASSGTGEELEEFLKLHEETASRQGFALRTREYYLQFMRDLPSYLIMARHGEKGLLAGAVLLVFGDEAYYLYGASASENDNVYASYLVQFEMMNIARRAGAKRYDMGGIPCDPHEDHSLWGVYQFKKKFGGEQKRFVGAYEKDLRPARAKAVRAGINAYYVLQKLRGKSSGPLGG